MLTIGITGGIGTGKTTVCKVFEILKIPVFYADNEAKLVMHRDEGLKRGIMEAFGINSYNAAGELDRKYLADIVFKDQAKLALLNSLVHPAVFRAFDSWATAQADAPYVLREAALLYESGSYKTCDYSVLITSPMEIRISRVMKRDLLTSGQIIERINKQWSDDEKEKLADFVLRNDESRLLIPQILSLHTQFLKVAQP